MSKHLIFFIHGMGEHKSGWSDAAQRTLREAADQFSNFKGAFDDNYQFVELNYDPIFENYRQQWRNIDNGLVSMLQHGMAPPGIIRKVLQLNRTLATDNFFTTHLLDVVMYRFLALVNTPIRLHLAQSITDELIKAGSGCRWSVVAHSLGTSVAHDTLQELFTGNAGGLSPLNANQFAPQCGLFIANVSRLLQNYQDVYQSLVRPALRKTQGIFQFYLSAAHRLDPFIKPRPFDPPMEWLDANTQARNPSRYQYLKITEVLDRNVHGLEHYLSNPKVHIAFFRAISGNARLILEKELQAAIKAHQSKAQQVQLFAVKTALEQLVETTGFTFDDLIDAAETYHNIITF